MIYSHEIERQCIAGFIQYPEKFAEFSNWINSSDFFSEVNKVIYSFIKSSLDQGDHLDHILLSEKIKLSGISFEDNINIADYIQALSLVKISKNSLRESARQLKKLTVRREISSVGSSLQKEMKSVDADKTLTDIIDTADSVYSKINTYDNGESFPQNIFEEMEFAVEEKGNNPVKAFGPPGPHARMNDLYGSLFRPGNIAVVVARTGVGKTQFVMDFCTKVSKETSIPVLHLDNGEMSKEELLSRQCAAISGVPLNLIETGQWRQAGEEIVEKIRSVWPKIQDQKFYYQNVGGMPIDSMIQMIKHFYYSKVKRGNPLIISYDYIKTTSENLNNKNEWQVVGEMVDKLKRLIAKDILFDSKPVLSLITSVQSNRSGITNNRSADTIVDDESVVSLSDRITQFCTHLFHLRKKTLDQLTEERNLFGTHILKPLKGRHLGNDVHRSLAPVRMPNGDQKDNYVNLNFDNFNITEVGDLQDMVNASTEVSLNEDDPDNDLGI